jgi:hypothetical protein
MKRASSRVPGFASSNDSGFVRASVLLLIAAFAAGCGPGMKMASPTTPVVQGNTMVVVMASSTANDQFPQFNVAFSGLTLTSQSGKTANLFNTPQKAEFIHLNGTAEPMVSVSVPQDVYTAASATIQNSGFECVSLLPTLGGVQTSAFGPNAMLTATLTLPSPITVSGTAMGLLLNLQVEKSATTSNCSLTGATYSITPTFSVTPVTLASSPTNVQNGKMTDLIGQIASVDGMSNSFIVTAADGPSWPVQSNGGTVYQGVAAFSTLVAGMPVDMDVAIQSDGSLLATRVAVDDANPTNLSVLTGPLLYVASSQPSLFTFGREEQGFLFAQGLIGGPFALSFGNAVCQISGRFTNLQALPFAATFSGANLFAGQNVSFSAHALTISDGPTYVPAATVTLKPQTINGEVSAVSNEGSFTTYTVSLAPYDLMPALAVQPGQTNALANPGSIVVYVDSSTQMLNTKPAAVGSLLRFNGLLFNDDGTLRMDCGQVNDGVAE